MAYCTYNGFAHFLGGKFSKKVIVVYYTIFYITLEKLKWEITAFAMLTEALIFYYSTPDGLQCALVLVHFFDIGGTQVLYNTTTLPHLTNPGIVVLDAP